MFQLVYAGIPFCAEALHDTIRPLKNFAVVIPQITGRGFT